MMFVEVRRYAWKCLADVTTFEAFERSGVDCILILLHDHTN